MKLKRILIIQTASLGDVILATPLIEKLSHFYPNAKIDFLLKYGYEDVLRRHPKLHHVIVWDKSEKKYQKLFELIKIFREKKYDLIVNVQRFLSSGIITVFSDAHHTVGFDKNPMSIFFSRNVNHIIGNGKDSLHEVQRNLRLIEHLTDNSKFPIRLYPSKQDYAKVSQYKTNRFITISPASLWFTKQYPKQRWIEFVKKTDSELFIYFLGSPKEVGLCNEIIKESGHINSINLAGKLTILQSTALMENAIMNFVNDSAPMHMASSVNAPTAAIFCSTVPEFGFGPQSDNSIIIETKENLSCRPCGLHGLKACPKKHFNCAHTIETEQLLNLAK